MHLTGFTVQGESNFDLIKLPELFIPNVHNLLALDIFFPYTRCHSNFGCKYETPTYFSRAGAEKINLDRLPIALSQSDLYIYV